MRRGSFRCCVELRDETSRSVRSLFILLPSLFLALWLALLQRERAKEHLVLEFSLERWTSLSSLKKMGRLPPSLKDELGTSRLALPSLVPFFHLSRSLYLGGEQIWGGSLVGGSSLRHTIF